MFGQCTLWPTGPYLGKKDGYCKKFVSFQAMNKLMVEKKLGSRYGIPLRSPRWDEAFFLHRHKKHISSST